MKFLTLISLILLFSCDDPLSKKDTEKTYVREFSNKSLELLKSHSQQWLFKNLEKVEFQTMSDTSVLAGNAEDFNFDGDDSKLFFKFFLKIENDKYTLTLKADYKEVESYNYDSGGHYTESEEIKESDEDDIKKTFNKIDRQLYDYIIIASSQSGSF